MKKTARNILVMLAVLLVLGGAVAALVFLQPGTGGEETSSSAPESSAPKDIVTDRAEDDVAAVSVENREGSFRIVAGEGDASFVLEGLEQYDVDDLEVATSAKSVLSCTATKTLGPQDALKDFGLSGDEAAKVTIQCKDGSEDQLVLGNVAGASNGRYVLKDGVVYIVPGISEMLYGSVYDYFLTEIYSIPDRTQEVTGEDGTVTQQAAEDRLDSMILSGSNFPEPIHIQHSDDKLSGYLITEPVTAESGSTAFTEMLTAMKTLSASGVADVGLSDETLEKYGLKEPFAQVEFTLNGEKHTLAVSEKDNDGNRYLTADDRDTVYVVSADTVACWAEKKLLDLRMSYVWLPNIMEVENLTLTVDGDMVYSYDITRTEDEENSTEDKKSYTLTVKNAAGKDIEYENYRSFYQEMLSVSVLSTDKAEYGGTPVLRAECRYFDGGESDVVEYYPVGTDRYAAVLNGGFNGLVRKSQLDKLLSLIEDLDAGKEVVR